MKKIKFAKNKFAIVDDNFYEKLKYLHWYLDNYGYPYTIQVVDGKQKNIRMHKMILKISKEMGTDHINNNKLDNRRCNLRECSQKENLRNKSIGKNNTTGYKGVYYCKSRQTYQAHITVNWKHKFLGTFDDKIEAAKVYNSAALKYFGEFARLNDIIDNDNCNN